VEQFRWEKKKKIKNHSIAWKIRNKKKRGREGGREGRKSCENLFCKFFCCDGISGESEL